MKKKLLTTCAILLAVITGATMSYADAGGDFTLYPSQTHNGNKNWIIRNAASGSVIEESLSLENLSDKRLEISLLVREAVEENGNFTTTDSHEFENIGSWINPEANSYTLEPHKKIDVPVMISIPADAEKGKYTAAIFASKKDAAGSSLNIVTQIGVRVYLTVSPAANGYANIFGTQEYGKFILLGLSALGLFASILNYLINSKEKKYADKIS